MQKAKEKGDKMLKDTKKYAYPIDPERKKRINKTKEVEMRELQYQISTGRWVDCTDEKTTEQYLTLCERVTGKSRQ